MGHLVTLKWISIVKIEFLWRAFRLKIEKGHAAHLHTHMTV